MQARLPPHSRLQDKYEAWERSAGEILLVVATCFMISLFVRVPNPMFAIGSFAAGVFAFFAWRSALRGLAPRVLALVGVSIGCALGALSTALNQPLALLMIQGIGLMLVALFSGILIGRRNESAPSTTQ